MRFDNDDEIVERVLAAVNEEGPLPSASGIAAVRAASREVAQLVAQGKPEQRRRQLVFFPAVFYRDTGREISSLRLGQARDWSELLDPAKCPDASVFVDFAAAYVRKTYEKNEAVASGREPVDWDDVAELCATTIVPIFLLMRANEFGSPNVFLLRDNIAERLLATDAPELTGNDVKPPFPGFYIQLPPGLMQVFFKGDEVPLSFIGVAEVVKKGERLLLIEAWGEGRHYRSSRVVHVLLPRESRPDVLAPPVIYEDETAGGSFGRKGAKLPGIEGLRLLEKLIVNFCLYLSSPNPDISDASGNRSWSDTITVLEAATRTSPELKRKPLPGGKNFAMWDAGRNTQRLVVQKTDVVVRGYFKRQPHGPRSSLRRLIWVEPHIRNPTGIEAPGHDYDVAKNKRSSKRRSSKRSSKRSSSKRTSRRR
jgi:hypothetical protein